MRTSQANMHDFTLSFAKPYSMQALSSKCMEWSRISSEWPRPRVLNFGKVCGLCKAKLAPLAQEHPTFPWLRNRKAQWVKPMLSMRVKHLAGSRLLRHATVRAISSNI